MVKAVGRKSIYRTSFCLYYTLKLLGMAFYSFDSKAKSFRSSCWHYIGLMLCVTYWIFQSMLHYKTEVYYNSGLSFRIVESIWRRVFEFQIFSSIPIILFNFIKRKHVENFMQFIEKFDAEMDFLEWKNNVRLSCIVEILPIFPIILLICNYIVLINFEWTEMLHFYPTYVYHIKFLAYLITMEVFFIISYLFVVSCWCISRRVKNLTENLR